MDCHITHKTEASHKNKVMHLFLWLLESASWYSEMCGLNFQVDLGEHQPHVIAISHGLLLLLLLLLPSTAISDDKATVMCL
jgi:hypothetical protein